MENEVIEITRSIAEPFESLKLKAYWDAHPHGFPTQGWGRLMSRYSLKRHLEEGKTREQANEWLQTTYPPITKETADEWLSEDLNYHYKAVRRLVKVNLVATQLAALTDFSFNCGPGNLQISTLLRLVNRGEFDAAGQEFPKWNKSGGIILRGLTRRRLVEQKLWYS